MNGVEYLLGSGAITNQPLPAFSPETMAFCTDFSARLMRNPAARQYPDLTALSFWCRKGNLQKLQENCPEAERRLGRGLCFHITPGNIPVNFAFSYLFGLLSGCSNLVRLPSREFPQTKQVCDVLRATLTDHPEIQCRTAFVRYPSAGEATAAFSREADARLIWGGDATIAAIRSLPTKPRCVDVCFADRYSVCVINGPAVLAASEETIRRLAEGFYNDTYLMDQNACSSPQLILWQRDSAAARERFWDAAYDAAYKRYALQAAVSVDKYTRMCGDGVELDGLERVERRGNLLYRAQLSRLSGDLTALRGTGGYFYEYGMESFAELAPHITEKYQTVTYFGLDPEDIRAFVIQNRLRGVDRIAPVGKAMDIGLLWDGFDLVRTLSRIVNVE